MFSKTAKSTIIGVSFSILLITSSMVVSGHIGLFWNLPSALITIGGTFGAVLVSFPPSRLKTLGPVMMKAFRREKFDIAKDVETITKTASEILDDESWSKAPKGLEPNAAVIVTNR